MVKEHRFIFEVPDLDTLVVVCRKCEQEIPFRVDSLDEVPNWPHCPRCGDNLFARSGDRDLRKELLITLRDMLKSGSPSIRFSVKLPED